MGLNNSSVAWTLKDAEAALHRVFMELIGGFVWLYRVLYLVLHGFTGCYRVSIPLYGVL